jgi:Arc/MetJ family transcription regulator
MRTTLDIPEELVEEARAALGYKSKTDTVIFALKEIVRRDRIEELKDLIGKIDLDYDALEKARQKEKRRARDIARHFDLDRREP